MSREDTTAMDVAAIEDDAMRSDEEEEEACPEGFRMARKSGYLHFSDQHRPAVTLTVNAEEGLAPREKSQKIMKNLADMWGKLDEAAKKDWKDKAPMVKRKIKKKKEPPAKKAKTEKVPSPTPFLSDDTLVGPYPIDEDALRKLKRLHDDGVIDDKEFQQSKAKALGLAPNNGPATPSGHIGMPYTARRPPPPSPRVPKDKKEKPIKMELPQACLEPYLEEDCTCAQENPKRTNTKSYDAYESYKAGETLQAVLDLGAKKADLAHDIARNYVTLDDPEKQASLIANLRPPKKREPSSVSKDELEADKAFVAIVGRYYIRRVNVEDPEASLNEGASPPANYRNATGALLLEAPDGKAAGGSVVMKGINAQAGPNEGKAHAPKLQPKSKVGKVSSDGYFTFKLKAAGVSGALKLKAAAASDANGAKILVGSYKIKEGETEWVEVVRCFRADDDTDDWPDDVLVSAEA